MFYTEQGIVKNIHYKDLKYDKLEFVSSDYFLTEIEALNSLYQCICNQKFKLEQKLNNYE